MKVSLVIAAYNEGPDLEATVALALASKPAPYEVLVVDDCSTTSVSERLQSFPRVKVLRTPKRLGAGPAKNYGGQRAEGDMVVLMDAHLRFSQDWLRYALDAHARYPNAVLCGVSTGFEQHHVFTGSGARFSRREHLGLGLSWLGVRERELIDLVPAVLGGCYFIPRKIWDTLGGLNPNLQGWGYEEQDLSLRAWASGFECRAINALHIQHNYTRNIDSKDRRDRWEVLYNALVVALTVFDDDTFNQRFLPYAKWCDRSLYAEAAKEIVINRQDIEDYRDQWQSTAKVFDDFEIEALTGFGIPTRESILHGKDEHIAVLNQHAKDKEEWQRRIEEHDRKIDDRIDKNCGCDDRKVDVDSLPGM